MFEEWSRRGSGRSGAQVAYPVAMVVSARDVAREIRRRLPGIGDVKLQKLLYYCQGHHLGVLDQPLFHERISAFDLGPVVGQVWYAEKNHLPEPPAAELDEAALNTVGYVISRYGGLSGSEPIRLTHGEAPWQEADAARRQSGARSHRIPEPDIRDHFRSAREDDEPQFDQVEIEAWLRELVTTPREAREPVTDAEDVARQIGELQRRRHPAQ